MRVSTKSDYALRAVVEMACREASGDRSPISAQALGSAQHIAEGFLLAILPDLRRAGILASHRGKAGGWSLARVPGDITIADVIRAVDGPLISVCGSAPEELSYAANSEVLRHVWIASRTSLREVFDAVSVADLQVGRLPEAVSVRGVSLAGVAE